MAKTNFSRILKLLASIIVCQLAGFVGSIFTGPAIPSWYANLTKPSFVPPNWIFGPVWISLFLLMGIAAFLVWQKGFGDRKVRISLGIFAVQLLLNTLWSILFFGLKSPILGFFDIVLLWIAILLTIIYFARVSKAAAILLLPYIFWVSFAALLNFSIWRIN
ncbi:MAG TPA: TspO/MBR family protein [candidate division Zixibacteria bacterium]